MYRIINSYADMITDSFDYESEIKPYIKIMRSSKLKKIDYEFIALYKQFYRLNAARLSDSFIDKYFEILKNNNNIDVYEIAMELGKISCNNNNAKRIHFSFSTKLKHTMNNDSPIFDSTISAFYLLPPIKPEWNIERKMNEYRRTYQFIEYEYSRILREKLLNSSIEQFDSKIEDASEISMEKKIDYLIWKYVSMAKQGKIRDKDIIYG